MNTRTKDRLTTAGAGVVITGMAVFMALTFGPLLNLTGTDTPSSDSTPSVSDPSVFKGVGDAPEHPTPAPIETLAPALPLDPLPAPDPEPVAEVPSGLPSGSAVPFIPSSDPNNAAGGDYDVSQCASGTASTIGGVPTCD